MSSVRDAFSYPLCLSLFVQLVSEVECLRFYSFMMFLNNRSILFSIFHVGTYILMYEEFALVFHILHDKSFLIRFS